MAAWPGLLLGLVTMLALWWCLAAAIGRTTGFFVVATFGTPFWVGTTTAHRTAWIALLMLAVLVCCILAEAVRGTRQDWIDDKDKLRRQLATFEAEQREKDQKAAETIQALEAEVNELEAELELEEEAEDPADNWLP